MTTICLEHAAMNILLATSLLLDCHGFVEYPYPS
jgi:hypothetical protein